MSLAVEWISRTLFNLQRRMADLNSLSQSVFYTQHHNIMCNHSTKISHIKCFPFFNIYERRFMHYVTSAASFKVDETLQSWHSRSSIILCNLFHIFNDTKSMIQPNAEFLSFSAGITESLPCHIEGWFSNKLNRLKNLSELVSML